MLIIIISVLNRWRKHQTQDFQILLFLQPDGVRSLWYVNLLLFDLEEFMVKVSKTKSDWQAIGIRKLAYELNDHCLL